MANEPTAAGDAAGEALVEAAAYVVGPGRPRSEDEAVFVRLMTRPAGDVKLARETIDRVLDLVIGHPELNEYKHTSVPA